MSFLLLAFLLLPVPVMLLQSTSSNTAISLVTTGTIKPSTADLCLQNRCNQGLTDGQALLDR